jgi:hypothetical protein
LGEFNEEVGELFGFEGSAAKIAPGAEGTVVAVALAGGGEQGFEEEDVFAVGELGRVDKRVRWYGVRCQARSFRFQVPSSKRGGLIAGGRRGAGGLGTPLGEPRGYSTTWGLLFPIRLEGHLGGEEFEAGEGVHDSIIE